LIAGSLRAGQRAATVSLIQSAKLKGYHPHAHLNDVLTRLALPLFFMVITFLYLLLKN
jgi:hypothetical protein